MDFWVPTQRALQGGRPLVKRPRLTDTLLKKPPFRFLHDVISEVCRQTGYAEGLFNEVEQLSTNFKDKERKIAYLWKIINCVGLTLATSVPALPLKIISGLEPKQTNIFLQMLAVATTIDKEKCLRAVSQTLAGSKMPAAGGSVEWIQRLTVMASLSATPASPQALSATEVSPSRSIEKGVLTMRSSLIPTIELVETIGELVTDLGMAGHSVPRQDAQFLGPSQEPCISRTLSTTANLLDGESSRAVHCILPLDSQLDASPMSLGLGAGSFQEELLSAIDNTFKRSSSVVESTFTRTRLKKGAPPATSSANEIKRQDGSTSSCATPERLCQPVLPALEETKTSNKPSLGTTVVHVKEDAVHDVLEKEAEVYILKQEDNALCTTSTVLVVPDTSYEKPLATETKCADLRACISTPVLYPAMPCASGPRPQSARKAPPVFRNNVDQTSKEGAGKLVSDISETKMDFLEHILNSSDIEDGDKHADLTQGLSFGSDDVQTKQEQVEALRKAVQFLWQTTNPLGRLTEYLQENGEVMCKEYQFYIKERELYDIKLRDEKRITEEMLQVEAGLVFEKEGEIQQLYQRINSLKAQILRNDEHIMTLLEALTNRAPSSWYL